MELVWYRMLGPILGGTVFTFGLNSWLSPCSASGWEAAVCIARDSNAPRPSSGSRSPACWKRLSSALPYALGDRIAVLAIHLRAIGAFGFWGYVSGWAANSR